MYVVTPESTTHLLTLVTFMFLTLLSLKVELEALGWEFLKLTLLLWSSFSTNFFGALVDNVLVLVATHSLIIYSTFQISRKGSTNIAYVSETLFNFSIISMMIEETHQPITWEVILKIIHDNAMLKDKISILHILY